MQGFKASYYNLRVQHNGISLLFNGKTSALLRLDENLLRDLRPVLGSNRERTAGIGYSHWTPPVFSLEDVSQSIRNNWSSFLEAGVFIPASEDERADLSAAYEAGRSQGPLFVTVTSTLDCNMRCYYCYQKEDELQHMSNDTCDGVAAWIKSRIDRHEHDRLYLQWYGGEPMLNQDGIIRLSQTLIPYCRERGVAYKASMVCNGTNWPADTDRFLRDSGLFAVQISIDGPQPFHDKRRGLIKSDGPGRTPSYDEVMHTIGALIGKVTINFRINVDPMIGWSALDMIDVLAAKGWLAPQYQFYPYVAQINAMTEHCGFIGESEKFKSFDAEFSDIQKAFYKKLGAEKKDALLLEKVMFYPGRKLINCAAINKNAVIFGPDGLMYRCGLEVGDSFRAHCRIGDSRRTTEPPALTASHQWDQYDPFKHERCGECQYLPVCLGGCPKAQLERDESEIRATSRFFEHQFDDMIRQYYDLARGA